MLIKAYPKCEDCGSKRIRGRAIDLTIKNTRIQLKALKTFYCADCSLWKVFDIEYMLAPKVMKMIIADSEKLISESFDLYKENWNKRQGGEKIG